MIPMLNMAKNHWVAGAIYLKSDTHTHHLVTETRKYLFFRWLNGGPEVLRCCNEHWSFSVMFMSGVSCCWGKAVSWAALSLVLMLVVLATWVDITWLSNQERFYVYGPMLFKNRLMYLLDAFLIYEREVLFSRN